MDDERPEVLTFGRLAHRTGLMVRTPRLWSDEGAVPPVARGDGTDEPVGAAFLRRTHPGHQ